IIVAVSDAQRFDLRHARVVEDLVPGAHALGGLYTGLREAAHPRCFVCACDMPFVNPRLVRALAQQARGYDAVIPRTAQGLQPLHAVYATSALGAMEAQLRRRQWDLHALVTQVRAKIIEPDAIHVLDPEERSFLNLNSPEEYLRALECGTMSWR
ncbi:MAG TPA: molybdenum cofactor guanylyltransferase, partial [archaeon]|nr:molybdenum cofactor guanylyltransferase [archaeon]